MSTTKPPAPIYDKPESAWPCHCCSCHTDSTDELDPKCHVHGDGHGQRGCLKHDVEPQRCLQHNCGCVTNQQIEAARHAEMQARGDRYQQQREHDAVVIEVNTEDTPEQLAALREAKRKAAAAQREAQQQQIQAAVDAAVQRALAERGEA